MPGEKTAVGKGKVDEGTYLANPLTLTSFLHDLAWYWYGQTSFRDFFGIELCVSNYFSQDGAACENPSIKMAHKGRCSGDIVSMLKYRLC